ncbi:MAG: PQQ-binding-like beta-propeller repeat protein [Candidatus Bathyarchaeota archaeon]|nr:PQQ-binding-like beta-propeller repeat protein [Candidatus Bathyarchaeota archaeon]
MKKINVKSKLSTIALLLVMTTLFALPITSTAAQTEVTSYAYLLAIPNPVGVHQTTYITLWVDAPLPDANVDNDIRRHDYKLTITKPDATTETKEWPVVHDTTNLAFSAFTPDQVGDYTLQFDYPGQTYTWDESSLQREWTGTVFTPASRTKTLTVTADPLPDPISSYPLPSEYWTRPIEGQNPDWYTITSHWLAGNYLGSHQVFRGFELWQKDGIAPESSHIMWTKPIEYGGVVGGTATQVDGTTYYSGGSYEGRFNNAIIMHGILYYPAPLGHSGSGGGYAAVDLRTGEELWFRGDLGGLTETGYFSPIAKGQLYNFEDINQHGVVGGVLWQTIGSTWNAYDGFTGQWMYNLTNVPSGTEVYTDSGEIVRYVMDADAGWLALWNFSAAVDTRRSASGSNYHQWRPSGKSIDTSTAYSWNVSIPDLPGNSNPAIVAVLPGDVILGRSSAVQPSVFRMPRGTPDPYTVWAISDRPENRGELLWLKNYPAPANTLSLQLGPVDPVNRVWTMNEVETFQWRGYSLNDGSPLWGPTTTEFRDVQYFGGGEGAGQRAVTAYGNLYVAGYAGEVFCYSTTDGELVWKYNNTDSGLQTPWGMMPIFIAAIADGKVYLFNNEHSPNAPLYKGYSIYCIDAENGNEIYKMLGWAGQTGGRGLSTSLLADGFLVYYSYYDNQIYCVGKGPSKTTVTVQNDVIAKGESILIKGMVTDTSSGTTQEEQAARFPNGVPAVADESMSGWMEYVYMQKPCPEMVTGVQVKLTAFDSNGGMEDIGTVTSDGSGVFTKMWTPENEGEYRIVAIFEGSKSYWTSYAETAIGVGPAPTLPEEVDLTSLEDSMSNQMTYILAILVIVIIALIIALYSVLKSRK